MDAGPDAVHLGPISPELALVDPVLAEQARKLLPDRPEFPPPRPVAPECTPSFSAPARQETVEPAPVPTVASPRRRWRRTVALAALVFAVGAATGGLLGGRSTSPGVALEVQSNVPTTRSPDRGGQHSLKQGSSTARHNASRGRARARSRRRSATSSAERRAARLPRLIWAENVLGVEAQAVASGLKLVWQRPANSGHVVVLRTPGAGGSSVVVYRGRATSYRDVSAGPCTSYRYTIVNYDRRGHRSTGVPTSVVTNGCT